MFPENTTEFKDALRSVREEGFVVDKKLALKLIAKFYEIAEGKKIGEAFRQIRNRAISEIGIDDLIDWAAYKLVIGRFFNPRAVRAKKKPSSISVISASSDEVELEVFGDISITFRARRSSGKLGGSDVMKVSASTENGSTWIPPRTYQQVIRKVLAVMNSRR